MDTESFGIMNEAYRVSRKEILDWINEALQLNLHKIEQLGTGAVECQLFDAYFPGTIKTKNINWMARSEHEFVSNFKLLQKGFAKKTLKKNIDVGKLVKCKYQDNLEFIQWLKQILQTQGIVSDEYDPVSERNGQDLLYLNKEPNKVQKLAKKAKSEVIEDKPKSKPLKAKVSINEDKEKMKQLEKDVQFVTHLLSFSDDNDEIVESLREHFKIENPN